MKSKHPKFSQLRAARLAAAIILILPASRLAAEQVNMVEHGKKTFELWGCAVCHVTTKDDNSLKTGPTLYNSFTTTPRDLAVMTADGKKTTVKADRDYLMQSVRKPTEFLAIAESGPTKGTAYAPIMPQFPAEIVTDADLEAIWHFLRNAADAPNAGPAVVMGELNVKVAKNVLDRPGEVIVTKRPRVYRSPMKTSSGRAIHVGLPNGMNYTFDPRMFSVRLVWGGGFLNMESEMKGRGHPGSAPAVGAKILLDKTPLLVPLTEDKKPIDLEFKEPDVGDEANIAKHLWKGGDFLKELAAWDSAFLGYSLNASGEPDFAFRVGKNTISERITFTPEGWMVVEVSGSLKTPQAFQVRSDGLSGVTVTGGKLADGVWTLPAGEKVSGRMQIKFGEGLVARATLAVAENFAPQPLQVEPATATMPPGYQIESWMSPTDTYGRKQLFEPTAMAVAKNGTLVVGTRTAGIWRMKDRKWELFAEGTYECLGLVIEDDTGDTIVIGQKPELTRLRDTNKDGRADQFITVCDDYGFHGNYHEYTHGPVRDAEGNYYFLLNLSHTGNAKASYRAGGPFMGSMGGFRGWACRVTPAGVFEPYAPGVRSPAGLSTSPDGRIVLADNQGEYMGSSKISYLNKGDFYGHPSSLVALPGLTPDSPEIAFDKWKDKIHRSALWLPHGKYANSPGSPAWDLTGGKFGPFAGQMFIGDQTLSTVMRVTTEKVGTTDQGAAMIFARGLASGVMRPCFLPDGSLLLGQTGRGWGSRGGKEASLQRISWDGTTVPAEISSTKTEKTGLTLRFTAALAKEATPEVVQQNIKIQSWTYHDSQRYGSGENEKRPDEIKSVTVSADRKSVTLEMPGFADPAKVIDRIYHLLIPDAKALFGAIPCRADLEAYQTIRAVPK